MYMTVMANNAGLNEPPVVTMEDNPILRSLTGKDLSSLLNQQAITEDTMTFYMGLLQLKAVPKEWLLMDGWFFNRLFR